MAITGGCQCGAIRYELTAPPTRVSICHCRDCQLSAGAPMVSWAILREDQFRLTKGTPTTYNSSGDAFRSFCGTCGTGLLYRNETYLPGCVDVQSVTLDNPSAFPPGARVQTAEQPAWMDDFHALPVHLRFPGTE
ncbi:MAG: GFA family protein [Hyphomonas sp.]|uniref:GFA family protein n=1 Tax=Hyphomonas sp. TaxID=87 RepID=UPI00179862E6|nr:GFA family protein [Hyphomonas sp.]MBA3070261.1 GFA family protein [Hyphomonas sp.]MBU3919408.1 GFA family protein [Alphaproteobacteria bacterium]MBU4062746.1 GFA family protein [Alphaproteobacteria bacterium]MBU4163665.1 GFA family protein [Alphaproteobacteria bacterium]